MSTADVLKLPLREKLQIMEAIWADLRERADTFDLTRERKNLLDARRERVAKGDAAVLDWESVKHRIGRE